MKTDERRNERATELIVTIEPRRAKEEWNMSTHKKQTKALKIVVICLFVLFLITAVVIFSNMIPRLEALSAADGKLTGLISAEEWGNKLNETLKKLSASVEKLGQSESESRAREKWLVKKSGWYMATNGRIYKYINDSTQNFTYSKSDCENRGARLMTAGAREAKVLSELWTHFQLPSTLEMKSVWIGLYQPIGVRGNETWIWLDGAEYDKKAVPWHSDEPNDVGGQDHCGELWMVVKENHTLNDSICSRKRPYICEKDF